MIFTDSPPEHRSAWKTVAAGGRKFLTLIVIGAGSLGLFLFARQLARQDQVSESRKTIRAEAASSFAPKWFSLWLPQTLIRFGETPDTILTRIRTYEELQRTLERLRQQDEWYAR